MIIRYLTKEKFEWLICDNGIYVGAASNQSDENEGIYNSKLLSDFLTQIDPNANKLVLDDVERLSKDLMLINRDSCYISSWYNGENETEEMWGEYGSNGVALVSQQYLLALELPLPLKQASLFYNVVYDNDKKQQAINEPLRVKEEKYNRESEYRLEVNMSIYSLLTGFESEKFGMGMMGGVQSHECKKFTICMPVQDSEQIHQVIRKKGSGYVIAYDLQRIIQEIRLHPSCTKENEQWVKGLLKSAELNIQVRASTIDVLNVGETLQEK